MPPDVSDIASVKKVAVTVSVPAAPGPPGCNRCLECLERRAAPDPIVAVHGYVVHVQDTATSARAPGNKITSPIVLGISDR